MSAEENIVPAQSLDTMLLEKLHVDEVPSPGTEKTANSEHQLLDVLQNNEEYMLLYYAIESLKSQLERAKSDMGVLQRLRDQALARPLKYVESIVAGTAPKAPAQQSVVDIPSIHIDSYLSHADRAAVQGYLKYVQSQARLHKQHLTTNEIATSSRPAAKSIRQAPARHVSASGYSTPTKIKSASKRGSHQPASAGTGLLTGITAVATPEHSPRRQTSQSLSHASALGLGNMNYPANSPPENAIGSRTSVYLVPPMDRANTEPVRRSSVSLSEPGGGGARNSSSNELSQTNGNMVFHEGRSKTSATQPGTPTGRAGSQKTLTPQMLEEFRRQVSEERSRSPSGHSKHARSTSSLHDGGSDLRRGEDSDGDGDDDEYYNQLVQAATAEHTDTASSGEDESDLPLMVSIATPVMSEAARQRPAGKSLNFVSQYLQQQQTQSKPHAVTSGREAHTATPKRGIGRPRKNAFGASTSRRIKKYKPGRRGPTRNDNSKPKPVNYNLPWTDEEQQRLEELLLVYPEEEVANDRWRKIGVALGTRTMRQVASRVQKYFIKLSKAGLPVPGRVPDTTNWTSIGGVRRGAFSSEAKQDSGSTVQWKRKLPSSGTASASRSRKRKKYVDFTSSSEDDDYDHIDVDHGAVSDNEEDHQSFFASGATLLHDRKGKQADRSYVPDYADHGFEFGDNEGGVSFPLGVGGSSSRTREPLFTDHDVSASASTSTNIQTPALRSAKAVHLGYRCDSCLAEPIVGIRWSCLECRGAHTVDLCDECREEGTFETDWHKITHNFHAVRDAEMEPYYANEVASAALREYSYLA